MRKARIAELRNNLSRYLDHVRSGESVLVPFGGGCSLHFAIPGDFASVGVKPDLGTICSPNDADWDQLVLYSRVIRRPIETLLTGRGNGGG